MKDVGLWTALREYDRKSASALSQTNLNGLSDSDSDVPDFSTLEELESILDSQDISDDLIES